MSRLVLAALLAVAVTTALAASVSVSPEQAQSATFLLKKWKADYGPEWFQSRYGIAAPVVDFQGFSALSGSLRIYYLRTASRSDQQKLWKGLDADRTMNQALARKGDTVLWILAKQDPLRAKALELLQPDETATVPTGLEWAKTELGKSVPGLAFYNEQFLDSLLSAETRAGASLRGVYQVVYDLQSRVPPGRKLAQVEYWFPRDSKQLPELVKALDSSKTGEQTVLSGKNVAIVTITRTDEATKILLDQLKAKGYRVESRVPSFATASTGSAPSSDPTQR